MSRGAYHIPSLEELEAKADKFAEEIEAKLKKDGFTDEEATQGAFVAREYWMLGAAATIAEVVS